MPGTCQLAKFDYYCLQLVSDDKNAGRARQKTKPAPEPSPTIQASPDDSNLTAGYVSAPPPDTFITGYHILFNAAPWREQFGESPRRHPF